MTFRELIGFKKLDAESKAFLRVATDIVSSWEIRGKWVVGVGTDMKDVLKKDLKILKNKYKLDIFEMTEISKGYYGIRFKNTKENIQLIKDVGFH